MSDYLNIKQAIVNLLRSIALIKEVYSFETAHNEGYPYAVLSKFNVVSNWIDPETNEREWRFTAKIYQEMTADSSGAENAESKIDEIVGVVFEMFDRDWTLGGVADLCKVDGGNAWEDRQTMTRVLELNISVKKVFNMRQTYD